MINYLAALMLGLMPASAGAAVKISCPSLQSLEENASECGDNNYFQQAGRQCLKAFEKAIQQRSVLAQAQLAASNLALVDKAGNSQNHNFGGSEADYDISQEALAELIDAGKKARNSVDDYLKHIYFPEDFDAPEEIIGDPMEFLDNNACYAEVESDLKSVLKKIDQHLAELAKTKEASKIRGNTSGSREGLQNSLTTGVSRASDGSAGAQPVPKKGNSQKSNSDITGIKEDEAKRQKRNP